MLTKTVFLMIAILAYGAAEDEGIPAISTIMKPIEIPLGIAGYRLLALPDTNWSRCPIFPGEAFAIRVGELRAAINTGQGTEVVNAELQELLDPEIAIPMKRFLLFKREIILAMDEDDPIERREDLKKIDAALAEIVDIAMPEKVDPNQLQPGGPAIRAKHLSQSEEIEALALLMDLLTAIKAEDEASLRNLWMQKLEGFEDTIVKSEINRMFFSEKDAWEKLIAGAISTKESWRSVLHGGMIYIPLDPKESGGANGMELSFESGRLKYSTLIISKWLLRDE